MINYHDLESWGVRASEALQEFCDEAQIDAGMPDGEDELPDIRKLLEEHSRIMQGLSPVSWQDHIKRGDMGSSSGNLILDSEPD